MGAMLWVKQTNKQTNKITVHLRFRYSMVDSPKTDTQELACEGEVWDAFFVLELCFLSSPVTTVLYRWPIARPQQLQCAW